MKLRRRLQKIIRLKLLNKEIHGYQNVLNCLEKFIQFFKEKQKWHYVNELNYIYDYCKTDKPNKIVIIGETKSPNHCKIPIA